MVSCSDIVVSISLYALDRVVRIKAKLIENLLVNIVFNRHQLRAWEKSSWLLIAKLPVPWVLTNLLNAIPIIWVRLENLGEEMRAIGR